MSDQQKQRNWFARHKVLTGILIFVVLCILGSALGGGDSKNGTSGTAKTDNKTYRFNDRADKQSKDVEIVPGETGTLDNVKLTVTSAEYKTALGEYETAEAGKTYVVADVTIENGSDRTQAYNPYDFRVQTTGGQVLDPTITGTPTLNSGDLVAGGKVTGKIIFEVPVEEGHQYLIWKPSYGSERVIVQVK